jgi:hypothetical protein
MLLFIIRVSHQDKLIFFVVVFFFLFFFSYSVNK